MQLLTDVQQFIENWPWLHYLFAVLIGAGFWLFRKIFTKYIFTLFLRLSKKTSTDIVPNLLFSFEKPLHFLMTILGFYLALVYLPIPAEIMYYLHLLFRSILIIVLGWGLYNFSGTSSTLFNTIAGKVDQSGNSMVIPFLSRIVRFLIIALTITVVAVEWGYNINGFIAGLGLGGLAFALAAQETLSNLFGGVVIIAEKPFKKDDWIETPSVEGLVEDINFRSTKIRTFADSLIIVPNSILAHEPITNWSEMGRRRITFSIGVTYTTPKDRLEACVEKIREYLTDHDDIDQEDILVYFDEFNESSLNIFCYFFTKTTTWQEWLEVKERVNFKVMDILQGESVQIAFPTRSIYVEEDPRRQGGTGVRPEDNTILRDNERLDGAADEES
ncbi:mechanosensitive ion channel family protein [Salsuginibacillus kocurii]|uniref:mechanosensitive ion channel family protein n=1 Tax=Salsuginibacillus kocurii TaxID=427078 RepID=UPI0003828460|nr:mechanosensitive ion channel family protein [Salsuginibacillus kocurii]